MKFRTHVLVLRHTLKQILQDKYKEAKDFFKERKQIKLRVTKQSLGCVSLNNLIL